MSEGAGKVGGRSQKVEYLYLRFRIKPFRVMIVQVGQEQVAEVDLS